MTATVGLFVSLLVVLGVKAMMPEADFKAWGWRIPFLLSLILVAMSFYIRMQPAESPVYAALKSQGKTSVAHIKEAFGHVAKRKVQQSSARGETRGQGVDGYPRS